MSTYRLESLYNAVAKEIDRLIREGKYDEAEQIIDRFIDLLNKLLNELV